MKRINIMISDEAKKKILAYQEQKRYPTLDETVDRFILDSAVRKTNKEAPSPTPLLTGM